jgi:hypothetical protein
MKELLRMKSRSPLVFWSLACTLLASCGGHILQGPDGTLQLKMQWPTAGFSTQVIPADTDRIELRIMASGEPTVSTTLQRQPGETEARWQQSFSPGEKRLSAQALSSSGRLLAEAETTVIIRTGQKSQAILDLVPEPEPTPTPTPVISASPSPAPDSGPTPDGNEASPAPSSAPSTAPSSPAPVASASPYISSGGGGGGGSGGSSTPVLTPIVADPAILSGMGFPTLLKTSINVANPSPTAFNWSCQEVDETNTTVLDASCPGSQFSPATAQGPEVYWQAPGLDTYGEISLDGFSKYYRITVTYTGGGSQSILITVPIGGGSVYPSGGHN